MSNLPLVSAITIFLNAERFIEEAITSVLAQTYNNWELLLVDDGSSDRSTAIAQHYAQHYPEQIRYLEHEGHQNKGMSESRNVGIAHAKGDYIAFLDADDVWLTHKLLQQVTLFESQPEAAMLYGRTQYWHSWTGTPEDLYKDCLTKQCLPPDQLVTPPTLLRLYLDDGQIYPCTCSVMVRKKTFENIGSFEADFPNANEDMVFYSKVFLQASVFVASQCWDRYRMNPDSYWSNYWAENPAQSRFHYPNQPHPERYRYLKWLETYLHDQAIQDKRIWRSLNKALWPYHHPRIQRFWVTPVQFLYWQLKALIWRLRQRILSPRLQRCLTNPSLTEVK
jgi:glycosyltransferase involved in cell wall biosynthesis